MAIIQRPPKQGGIATTYQDKVAQGYTKILAVEVDADFDTIYAAWNGGIHTVDIAPGAITGDKLAVGAVGTRELADGGVRTIDLGDLQVTTGKIADGAVTLGKLEPAVKLAGGDLSGQYPNPAVAIITSGALPWNPRGYISAGASTFDFYGNPQGVSGYNAGWPTYLLRLDYAGDHVSFWRAPAGQPANLVRILDIDYLGKLTGGAATGARVFKTPTVFSTSTYNTPVLVYTLPALTTRGGAVILTMMHSLYYSSSAVSGNVPVYVQIYRDGSPILNHGQNIGSGGAQVVVPIAPVVFVDLPSAGTHTYDLRVQIGSGTSATVTAAQAGECTAQEIG